MHSCNNHHLQHFKMYKFQNIILKKSYSLKKLHYSCNIKINHILFLQLIPSLPIPVLWVLEGVFFIYFLNQGKIHNPLSCITHNRILLCSFGVDFSVQSNLVVEDKTISPLYLCSTLNSLYSVASIICFLWYNFCVQSAVSSLIFIFIGFVLCLHRGHKILNKSLNLYEYKFPFSFVETWEFLSVSCNLIWHT